MYCWKELFRKVWIY